MITMHMLTWTFLGSTTNNQAIAWRRKLKTEFQKIIQPCRKKVFLRELNIVNCKWGKVV